MASTATRKGRDRLRLRGEVRAQRERPVLGNLATDGTLAGAIGNDFPNFWVLHSTELVEGDARIKETIGWIRGHSDSCPAQNQREHWRCPHVRVDAPFSRVGSRLLRCARDACRLANGRPSLVRGYQVHLLIKRCGDWQLTRGCVGSPLV